MKNCMSCGSTNFISDYNGNIRSGSWPKMTEIAYDVIGCKDCGLAFLSPFPQIDYTNSDYRVLYNDSDQIDHYFRAHDHEQTPRISKIGIDKFRGKTILDMGCGGGSFLDAVKGISKQTIAVEPFDGYHSSLIQRGHEVFSSGHEALQKYVGKIDIVVSFGVIEHVLDPNQYLTEAWELLIDTGVAIIETDNKKDFLMTLDLPEFKNFFYRTAHYWYFTDNSLKKMLVNTGFKNVKNDYRHGYDLSNAFHWMLDRMPTGLAKTKGISSCCDEAWRLNLEQSGQAELLHFTAIK